MTHANRSAYVRSPWQFEVRDNPVADPGPGQLLVRIAACAVCGTDLHIADRRAKNWQPLGHEVSGTVLAVGAGVTGFAPGMRVALDSSAPCGRCPTCLPGPRGRGRPDLCPAPATYYGSATMGFGEILLAPQQSAVVVPDAVPLEAASLVEPLGVSFDLVHTAEVSPGDHVLVVGPGPLGLGAVALCRRAGAARVMLAGRSTSVARLRAGAALGADEIIAVDETPLTEHEWGGRPPDKILVTAPPPVLVEAIRIAPFGGLIAYIGIAFGPDARIELDADDFHFRKLSLRASHASPGTHAASSIRLLETMPELGREMISHRFRLGDIGDAFARLRHDRSQTVKLVMIAQ
jgi:L-iditol 2-dehydrogenase